MGRRSLLTALLLAGIPARARAQGADPAVTAGATAGAMAGAQSGAVKEESLFGPGPEEWTDPRTLSTSRFFANCGHIGEILLSVNARRAWLTLYIENATPRRSTISPEQVTVSFDDRITRSPVRPGQPTSLDPGWGVAQRLMLPAKADFEGTARLRVDVPVAFENGARCIITTEFARDTSVAQPAESYAEYSTLEIFLGAGPRLFLAGDTARYGSRQATIELGFAGSFSLHHGWFFDMLLEPHGDRGVANVLGREPDVDPTTITSGAFSFGYSYRLYALPWLPIAYGAGLGFYFVELLEDEESVETGYALALGQRLRAEALFAELFDGSRFGVGLTGYHLQTFGGDFGRLTASGATVGLSLHLTVTN